MTTDTTHTGFSNKTKQPRVIIHNLTPDQKKMIMNGGLGLGGFVGGAGVFALLGNSQSPHTEMSSTDMVDEENAEVIVVPTEMPYAYNVHDDMSFGEAFKSAREEIGGGGGFFEWKGHSYNTYTTEEWNEMDDIAQDQFMTNVYQSTNFQEAELMPKEEVWASAKGINIDNDSTPEITIKDIDSDGTMDVHQIDLNNDGHIDIEHVTSLDNADDVEEFTPIAKAVDQPYVESIQIKGHLEAEMIVVNPSTDGASSLSFEIEPIVIEAQNADITIEEISLDDDVDMQIEGMEEINDMDSELDIENDLDYLN